MGEITRSLPTFLMLTCFTPAGVVLVVFPSHIGLGIGYRVGFGFADQMCVGFTDVTATVAEIQPVHRWLGSINPDAGVK